MKAFYQEESLNVETYDARAALETLVVKNDLKFFLEEARRRRGPVLDLGAGTGRVSWLLAEAGFEVTGIEISEPMLRRARAKAAGFPDEVCKRVRFEHADMRDFRVGGNFGLAVVPFRSFQCLLTPEDQGRCLARVHEHLAPAGGFVVDLFDPRLDWCVPDEMTDGRPVEIRHGGGETRVRIQMRDRRADPLIQRISESWVFSEIGQDGRILREETEKLELRWTYRQEARYLFERHGFEIEAEYSDFLRSPPAYAKEQVWVLRKA